MATITIRNLDDDVQRRLRERASGNGRSMEAEARFILGAAVSRRGFASSWLAATASFRGDDLPLPDRATPRGVDLS
jgi:plasmid stability protein